MLHDFSIFELHARIFDSVVGIDARYGAIVRFLIVTPIAQEIRQFALPPGDILCNYAGFGLPNIGEQP